MTLNKVFAVLWLLALCFQLTDSADLYLRVILTNGKTITKYGEGTATNPYKAGASKVQVYYYSKPSSGFCKYEVRVGWNGWFAFD